MGYIPLDLERQWDDPTLSEFGWAQRQFLAEVERQYNTGKPVRIITLKARQLGISTVTEAILYWWGFLHPGTNGLVMAHETASSLELFEMTKRFWDTWTYKDLYTLKSQTRQNLHWAETGSRLRVATARNIQSGRGSTFHAVHASEVAFYHDPDTLMTGLDETVPNLHKSIIVLESTANGVGDWFYENWQRAEEGDSQYTPLFFPWFKHPEYRLSTTLSIKSELNSDERDLLRLGASFENIAWRRWKLKSKDLLGFQQEYPATPEEAFITSGRPIFSPAHLAKCFDDKETQGYTGRFFADARGNPRFIQDPSGPWTIFKQPRAGDTRQDRYFIAADPSLTTSGDPGCIQIINRQTFEQVAVYHNQVTPRHMADEMIMAGKFYNEATLCPEVEGGGQVVVERLLMTGYPNIWLDKRPDRLKGSFNVFGWWTNYNRKQWCIGVLQSLILDGSLTLHDRKTYNQLRNFVEHENGYWGNSDKQIHDDAVMALAICVTASIQEGPFTADSTRANPILDIYHQEYADAAINPYAIGT